MASVGDGVHGCASRVKVARHLSNGDGARSSENARSRSQLAVRPSEGGVGLTWAWPASTAQWIGCQPEADNESMDAPDRMSHSATPAWP